MVRSKERVVIVNMMDGKRIVIPKTDTILIRDRDVSFNFTVRKKNIKALISGMSMLSKRKRR